MVSKFTYYLILPLIITATTLWPTQQLSAQSAIDCTGEGCQFLPLAQKNLNSILAQFQAQYANILFDDMAEASTVANIASPPIGTINLRKFTIGVNAAATILKPYDVDIYIPELGTIENVPSGGGAISPRIFGGVNLGWVLGRGHDPFESSRKTSFLSPSRFDLYFSGLHLKEIVHNKKEVKGDLKVNVNMQGGDLRYHLIEGRNLKGGPLLRFRGLSLGIGYYHSYQSLHFVQEKDKLGMTISDVGLIWEGNNIVDWSTEIKSYPLELNTGLQLLYFMNLSFGVGLTRNTGYSRFSMQRVGNAYVESDLLALLGMEQPQSVLTLYLTGKGEVKSQINYLKLGVEFNIWAVKLSFGGIMTERTRTLNLGLRFEL